MTNDSASHISALGTQLGPDVLAACTALFDDEQAALATRVPPVAADLAYGPDARHRLDIYAPTGAAGLPVVLFVHGGGFLKGDKAADGWPNGAVGRWAATQGMIGVVINYRLAPEYMWPAGSEDVGSALDWLVAHISSYGGDPERIALMGTSAGAVHVAGHLKLAGATQARAAILLSGLYGFTPLDPRDELYYGAPDLYGARMPKRAVIETGLPLFLACAEFDPLRFQAEFEGLMQARRAVDGTRTRGYRAEGHNHYSLAMHLGTADTRLGDAVLAFLGSLDSPARTADGIVT